MESCSDTIHTVNYLITWIQPFLFVFCEVLQYLTGCGMADVNDVLFNTLGAAVGVWLARRIA